MGPLLAKSKTADDVSIGKFDIVATYTYARAVLIGMLVEEPKVRDIGAAISPR